MKEKLRSINRGLLELLIGILISGSAILLVVITISLIRGADTLKWTVSLLTGVIMSLIAAWHISFVLDRGLEYGDAAQKKIFAGYMLRYAVLAILFTLIAITKYLDVIVAFVGYMSMKLGAYLQPFTHKLTNKYFNETDPIPMSLEELEALEEAERKNSETNAQEAENTETIQTEV